MDGEGSLKVRFAVSVGLGLPDPEHLSGVATRAEAEGFDTIWMSDLPSLEATDPLLGVAHVAATTRRMHLGINLIPFGSAPYVVAHRLAQLDRITGGRLLVTLVPGLDLPAERVALGTAGRHRGRLMEELVPMLRAWWAGDEVATGPEGETATSPEGGTATSTDGGAARLPVRPLQDPLEIWLGGSGPDAIGRAGRVSDGWLGSAVSPARAGRIRRAIEAEAAAAGRVIDPEHFGLSIGYARTEDDLGRGPLARIRRSDPDADPRDIVPVGADGLRNLIGRLVDEGLSKFVVRPVGPVEDWSGELSWLAATVLHMQT